MSVREIPSLGYDSETRNKILDIASEHFALKGFDAVSMRDIAKAVGIKMSSIYYYYESKEALLEDVLSRFEEGYRLYFDWLSNVNSKVESLEELMDNMFNKEFLEMLNPPACLGISLAIKEQHNNEVARRRVFELLYEHSIRLMKADFDRLIEKGIIPPSDTKTIATIFMFCVMVGNDISIHQWAGANPPIDSKELYRNMKKILTASLLQGSQDSDENQEEV
ncbi:TetR/AcrR family transcriptional regulator [Selenomonadales bacterium OttesenSCG-928-I06]|nr:TetR/AcrR family transcriptional regulator [Selenomonadales bacterium OttesenSCG-928-I06]